MHKKSTCIWDYGVDGTITFLLLDGLFFYLKEKEGYTPPIAFWPNNFFQDLIWETRFFGGLVICITINNGQAFGIGIGDEVELWFQVLGLGCELRSMLSAIRLW